MLKPFSNQEVIDLYSPQMDAEALAFLDRAVGKIVEAKRRGGKVVVATGSGPNLHEGVTTLIAELMNKGIIDGVTTSSAVIAHEMAGTLDRVKRLDGRQLGFGANLLPKGFTFEFTELPADELADLRHEMEIDDELLARGRGLDGNTIIKAAGNMAYPMGLRTERLAREITSLAHAYGLPFETVAGWGADPRTMIGAGAQQRSAGSGQRAAVDRRRRRGPVDRGQHQHDGAQYARGRDARFRRGDHRIRGGSHPGNPRRPV